MATFEITGPDGKKYRVSGETAEGALQALQKHLTPDPRDNFMGKIDSVMRGAADTLTLGLSDEIAAGLGTGFGILGDYDAELARQRGIDKADAEDRFGYRLGGQIGGAAIGGAGLAKSGLSLGANAVNAGQGLGRVALGSAADGAILGALQGAGSGEGLEGRLASGATGLVTGVVLGGAAPYAVAGGSAAAKAVAAPIMARLRPDTYATSALGEGIRRSGMSADDIVNSLARAQADDQTMFNVADAMGNSGQRMLSTVTRTPNGMRQTVVDTLTDRQMSQSERLVRALSEGFDAPDTASARARALEAGRNALADVNYGNARVGARPVNLSGAIDQIDTLLGRDPIMGESALSRGALGLRLKQLRDQMQRGGEQLIDFDRVLNLKSDMFQQMKRNPDVASDLRPVYSMLDDALERASPQYRAANDAFRAQSRAIDAVDAGKAAASNRTRAADNISQFQAMRPGEKSAFRAGYIDPKIASIESSSLSPTTNRARPLITEKTGQEFPAFAIPQRADKMGRRIAREQRMFETANAAMGGSKTADNLADAAEMSKFDPGVMTNLLRGRPVAAVIDAVTKMANEAKGMPPSVMESIARTLLETNPQAARQLINAGAGAAARSNGRRALAQAIAVSIASSGAGRLAAP